MSLSQAIRTEVVARRTLKVLFHRSLVGFPMAYRVLTMYMTGTMHVEERLLDKAEDELRKAEEELNVQ